MVSNLHPPGDRGRGATADRGHLAAELSARLRSSRRAATASASPSFSSAAGGPGSPRSGAPDAFEHVTSVDTALVGV